MEFAYTVCSIHYDVLFILNELFYTYFLAIETATLIEVQCCRGQLALL